MALSTIYVSGSYLGWLDSVTGAPRRMIGAIPSSTPSGFSGQPSGRIWVAQDANDDYLWYSDSTGQTRFVEGIPRGSVTGSQFSGKVYVNSGSCTGGTDLWWNTPSGSSSTSSIYSVRDELSPEPWEITLQLRVSASNPTSFIFLENIGEKPVRTTTTVATNLIYGTDDASGTYDCTGTTTTYGISLTLNPGQTITSQSLLVSVASGSVPPGSGNVTSYLFSQANGVLSINSSNTTSVLKSAGLRKACVGIDTTFLAINPNGCYSNLTPGSVFTCGKICNSDVDCAGSADGCPYCRADLLNPGDPSTCGPGGVPSTNCLCTNPGSGFVCSEDCLAAGIACNPLTPSDCNNLQPV